MGDDGCISCEELEQVLTSADVNRVWSKNVCEEVARGVVEEFGGKDGSIHFSEWLRLMQESATRHEARCPRRTTRSSTSFSACGSSSLDLSMKDASSGSIGSIPCLKEHLEELPTKCSSCGNIFMADSQFCRKCGQPRKNSARSSSQAQSACGSCG